MIANLPLLFANGVPTSLSSIRIPELECFITFMVQCSLGHDTVRVVKKPAWWPTEVEFSNPFSRPPIVPQNWGSLLRQLVRQCYEYHDCMFLLSFSAKLARHSRSKLKFVDNRDRTTSIYDEPTSRLLVTFRNENLLYDQGLRRRRVTKPPKTTQLRPADIYLCDYCDSHFDSYVGLQTHERLCGPAPVPSEPSSQPQLPVSPEGTLDNFICALGLQREENAESTAGDESLQTQKIPVRQVRAASAANFAASLLPFSSLAGRKYARAQSKYSEDNTSDRSERYCSALPHNHEQPRWLIRRQTQQTFPVRYRRPDSFWPRQYKHPVGRHKPALDVKSQLLYLQCKPFTIPVQRLAPGVIEKYEKLWRAKVKEMKLLKPTKNRLVDEDVEFVCETIINNPLECAKLRKYEVEDIIDLCSDEDDIGNENTDPKAAFSCWSKNGFQQSAPAGTPFTQPSEPCGAMKRRVVIVPIKETVVHSSIIQPLNNIQVISIE